MIPTAEQERLKNIQLELAKNVLTYQGTEGYFPKPTDLITTLDIQYTANDDAFVAIDWQTWDGKQQDLFLHQTKAGMAYQSGFFAFREGKPLIEALQALEQKQGIVPDMLIIDGHGIAHPRRFGVACYVGIKLNLPTIGFAKNALLKYTGELQTPKGSTVDLLLNGETVGYVLRTSAGVKPIFVSVGHKMSLANCTNIVLQLAKTRLIEPIRRADQAARRFAKNGC